MANRAGERPQNIGHTIRVFVSYLGHVETYVGGTPCFYQRFSEALGTYMIKPVCRSGQGDVKCIHQRLLFTAVVLRIGALTSVGYANYGSLLRGIVLTWSRDLFEHIESLPLRVL